MRKHSQMQTLWNKFRHKAPIRCLIDTQIREYDITKANISVFRDLNLIDESMYQELLHSEKLAREITIGNLIANNPQLSSALSEGIKQAKKKFFELNEIQDEEILEIDNDAVFIIGGRTIRHQQISPRIFFRLDQAYTSFYEVCNIRYYYFLDRIQKIEILTPKGLGSKGTDLHSRYMLDFLKELFYTAQIDGVMAAIQLLSEFYKNYVSGKLDIEYYRELNSQSHFAIRPFDESYSYSTDSITYNLRKYLNTNFNEIVLREFNRLLFYEYTKGKR